MSIPAAWGNISDWQRMVARDLNPLVQGYPYLQLDADPDLADIEEGFTFYHTVDHVVKTYDGTSLQAHW